MKCHHSRSSDAAPPGPSQLLDMAKERGESGIEQDAYRLVIGDLVKVCFLVTDHKALWLPPDLRHFPARFASEAMWVRVTAIDDEEPSTTYHGILCNIPLCVEPKKLQITSPVTFEARHIHSVERAAAME
jgi:hypothetical protein